MNVLNDIVARKQRDLMEKKRQVSVRDLEASVYFKAETYSLKERLNRGGMEVIAEFKRRAPSTGMLRADASITQVVRGYADAGAAGVSVLTDGPFFGAAPEDLQQAASIKSLPLLRKDFILDEYQILEAKAMGADVVLLIASILTGEAIKVFSRLARSIGLEILLEIHTQSELEKYTDTIDLIGVNNRKLETFETDLDQGIRLLEDLPAGVPAVSESGIRDVADATRMLDAGYDALLIGTQFMQAAKPEKAFEAFSKGLKLRHSAALSKPEEL